MIRIAVTPAAFEATAATLPLGSVGCEREPDDKGERLIWIEVRGLDKLTALRNESFSDVIARAAVLNGEVDDEYRRHYATQWKDLPAPRIWSYRQTMAMHRLQAHF